MRAPRDLRGWRLASETPGPTHTSRERKRPSPKTAAANRRVARKRFRGSAPVRTGAGGRRRRGGEGRGGAGAWALPGSRGPAPQAALHRRTEGRDFGGQTTWEVPSRGLVRFGSPGRCSRCVFAPHSNDFSQHGGQCRGSAHSDRQRFPSCGPSRLPLCSRYCVTAIKYISCDFISSGSVFARSTVSEICFRGSVESRVVEAVQRQHGRQGEPKWRPCVSEA